MDNVWSEMDAQALVSQAAKRAIWAQDFPDDRAALEAFIKQAQGCASGYEEASVAQEQFDYQLSQFVRRYVAHRSTTNA